MPLWFHSAPQTQSKHFDYLEIVYSKIKLLNEAVIDFQKPCEKSVICRFLIYSVFSLTFRTKLSLWVNLRQLGKAVQYLPDNSKIMNFYFSMMMGQWSAHYLRTPKAFLCNTISNSQFLSNQFDKSSEFSSLLLTLFYREHTENNMSRWMLLPAEQLENGKNVMLVQSCQESHPESQKLEETIKSNALLRGESKFKYPKQLQSDHHGNTSTEGESTISMRKGSTVKLFLFLQSCCSHSIH